MRILREPSVLRFLRHLTAGDGVRVGSDAQLLSAFAADRDEAAFTEIVRRHGPMVYNVCRRLLGAGADAEDAFQAVFLVLARKARRLREPATLAQWLYGVAYRTAVHVRTRRDRRQSRRAETIPAAAPDPFEEISRREQRRVLDEEVARLPVKYRTAVVLCYLEGLSGADAARQLGCPRATVATRLARACDRLRGPLARRGIVLSATAIASALSAEANAANPMPLIPPSVRAAVAFAASPQMAVDPSRSTILAREVLSAMRATRVKLAAVLLLAVVLIGTRLSAGLANPEPAPRDPEPAQAPAAPADKHKVAYGLKDLEGDWKVTTLNSGIAIQEMTEKSWVWKWRGPLMQMCAADGKAQWFAVQVDADKGSVDLVSLAGDLQGELKTETIPGIFKIEQGKLVLCLRHEKHLQMGRPTEFIADAKSWQALFTFERVEHAMALKGVWEVTEMYANGTPFNDVTIRTQFARDRRVEFTDTTMSWTKPRDGRRIENKYKLDAAKDPKQIDLTTPDGKVMPAIYRMRFDTLELCFDDDGKTRPTEFASREGSRQGLWILKRVKSP
jgi:RNA polymerase sigma factor (sigma-70 family)